MRGRALLLSGTILAATLGGIGAQTSASPAIVEVDVSFSVVNTNTTRTAAVCTPDGKPYTVRGTLAAPTSVLEEGSAGAVALYMHGSGDGSSWNFAGFPGVNHIAEMAALGHSSVFMHFLGYGTSDPIDGNALCLGSHADIAHQVVQHLRAGTYDVDGLSTPAFDRVTLVGHSGFSLVAELYSISYSDIDALIVTGWVDIAPAFVPLYTNAASLAVACAGGGEPKTPGGPSGWHRFFSDEDLDKLLYGVEPAVKRAFADRYEYDFCGLLRDTPAILASSLVFSPLLVTIPVLLVNGDHEPFTPGGPELKRERYLASDDVTLEVLSNTGHNMMMGRTAASFRQVLSRWLTERGL